MLQRIQTVYFFLASLVLLLFAFFADFSLLHVLEHSIHLLIPALASVLVAFLSLIVIFLFKNRNFQSKLSAFLLLLIAAVIAYFIYSFGLKLFYKEWTFYLLPTALFFTFLGKNNVDKDEKLVQSADRLR